MKRHLFMIIALLAVAIPDISKAGEAGRGMAATPGHWFDRGATAVEFLAGAYFSIDAGKQSKPTINFATQTFRYGIMLTTPPSSGLLAGNIEFLMEGSVSEVFAGPGSIVAAANLLFRYNFMHPHARIIPYFQVGGGGAYTDIGRAESQSLVGSEWNFSFEAQAGIRVMLNERVALLGEGGLVHFSNAGITDRNHGLNLLGGQVGAAISF